MLWAETKTGALMENDATTYLLEAVPHAVLGGWGWTAERGCYSDLFG